MQDTRTRILETAEHLLRTRGYSGFSYADIASSVGTTKANVHHHFGTKGDLGKLLINETKAAMKKAFAEHKNRSAIHLLKLYIRFFEQSVDGNLVCLCGMLLAEDEGLPPELRIINQEFVEWQLEWLEQVLSSGRDAGELAFRGAPRELASYVYSTIQGAHMVAKCRKDSNDFQRNMQQLLSHFEAA